jgi:hypothetical protein
MQKENIELLKKMSPESLADISVEDRKSLVLSITEEDLKSLPLDLQSLLTFEE